MSTHRLRLAEPNPALVRHAEERAKNVQNRVADRITAFSGSMNFVYLHIALFVLWMTLLEKKPWPTLTLVVSLEAIFLSTFVMISQNRAGAKRQVIAAQSGSRFSSRKSRTSSCSRSQSASSSSRTRSTD